MLPAKSSVSAQLQPSTAGFSIGFGVTAAISGTQSELERLGTFTGALKGIITGVNTSSTASLSTIEVKIVSQVSSAGTETRITYAEGNGLKSFDTGDSIFPVNNSGINTGSGADGAKSFTPVALSSRTGTKSKLWVSPIRPFTGRL